MARIESRDDTPPATGHQPAAGGGAHDDHAGPAIDPAIEEYLQGRPATELRLIASRARKLAAGKEDPKRAAGAEGGRWLEACRTNCGKCPRCRPSKEALARGEGEIERVHGPYWYLKTYRPFRATYTDEGGNLRSGRATVRYVGRRLPAELAREFGYPEGTTPEEARVHLKGA